MTEMSKLPWTTVHVDFYGPLPASEHLLVVVDRYSRFPEVKIVYSIRASTVIPKLDKIFSVHGIPDIINLTMIHDTRMPLALKLNFQHRTGPNATRRLNDSCNR